MPGPPPTRLLLRLLKGNPGKRRLPDAEPRPEIAHNVPDPPDFLGAYAKDEWRVVAAQLQGLGMLIKVDQPALMGYCHAYQIWRMAAEALAKMAAVDPLSGLLVKGAAGDATQNPLVPIARKAAQDMLRFAAEFGFTAGARARLTSADWEPPKGGGKFDGFLA